MRKRILIAPLDWGLGHATRCIPIIRELLAMGHDVRITGSGQSLGLLKKEFPQLEYSDLPGYNPVYPKDGSMVLTMSLQLPGFVRTIIREHRMINQYVRKHSVDLVISDNRYGCWSREATSVFITHQSNILMPRRFGWLSPWVRRANANLMRKFDICWIPDAPDHSLAGELISFGKTDFHPEVNYVGNLSRFKFRPIKRIDYDILAICSGPEPQRSILENILTKQLKGSGKKYLLVRGVPGETLQSDKVDLMTSLELEDAILRSGIVISRSGYSSVMDMQALGRKAIFIPTPGQTEQEYLAKRLKKNNICFSMVQDEFDLAEALRESVNYTGFTTRSVSDLLKQAIQKALYFRAG